MAYIDIANFKYGLDLRRSNLTSIPGTLQTLNNCHVNQGGEIEKRKAFVRTTLPASTFGLESSSTGLTTFGSNADPGGWPRGAVTAYQRLQHPAVLMAALNANVSWQTYMPSPILSFTADATKHAMTGIKWSVSFKGVLIAVATFADGNSFLYYDGYLVMQSAAGLLFDGFNTQQSKNDSVIFSILLEGLNAVSDTTYSGILAPISTDIVTFVKTFGILPTSVTPHKTLIAHGGLNALQFVTTDPTGVISDTLRYQNFATVTSIEPAIVINVTGGGIYTGQYHTAVIAGSAGSLGECTFTVGATFNTKTYVVNATWSQDLALSLQLNASVTGITSAVNTASLIATAINARTAITGFSASAVGAVVHINSPQLSSTVPFAMQYTWQDIYVTTTDATASGYHSFAASTFTYAGAGTSDYMAIGENWVVGNSLRLDVTNSSQSFTQGYGTLGGCVYTNGTVFGNRLYIANTNKFLFSALADPSGWEQQDVGAGFLPYTSQYGVADTVQAFSEYQGRLAVFARRSIQIWSANADPDLFALQQTLKDIGTIAPFSVQSIGEIDTFFLSDTGVRSLRAREAVLNGYINDLGSAIDILVQAKVLSNRNIGNACAAVEPSSGRYWLFIPDNSAVGTPASSGTLYVFSYFPTNKVLAWSTYATTYASAGAQVNFAPSFLKIYNGQIFGREDNSLSSAVYAYGGSDTVTYDACKASVQTGYLAGGGNQERPGTWKKGKALDCVCNGTWTIKVGMDWIAGTLTTVDVATKATYDQGSVPFSQDGTHFSLYAESVDATVSNGKPPTLSSIMFHYEPGQET